MFKQMGEMMSLLKNAREMQTRMEAMQKRLEEMRLSAESADGSIRVTASGVGEILSIDCHPPTDAVGRLTEIRDLVNDALRQAKERHMEEMKTVTGDVDLPGMQDALKWLSSPVNLIVAAGLALFGCFSLVEARFREIHAPPVDRMAASLS